MLAQAERMQAVAKHLDLPHPEALRLTAAAARPARSRL